MIFNAIVGSLVAAHKRKNATSTKMLRVMKLTAFLLFIACIHVSAHGVAQDHVTFSGKDVPLEKVFSAIKKQTNYLFLYNESYMKNARKVTITVKNASIKEVLDECMKDQPFDYNIEGKTIFLVNKQETPQPKPQTSSFQNRIEVKGRVVDENGSPIVGANVTVKGTNQGTATDENGYFSLPAVDDNAVILVSSIGFEAHELKISGKTAFTISLRKAINSLDETVVIAYGTTTKRFNTGNVSSVKKDEIEKQPVSNALAALEGRIPGMVITQNTGVPGGSFTVQIRGRSSVNPNVGNDPLYVIDGVPYTSTLNPNINNIGRGGNPLNFINISDIESISVLKDADATAIYGSRGANGVVLITTKQGKSGKNTIELNVQSGVGKVTRMIKMLNTQQFLQMRHEALKNDNVSPTKNNDPDLLLWDTTRYTDWQKVLIGGTAHYTDAQTSFSGGTQNSSFLIGSTYHKETTVYPGDNSNQKFSSHFNINSSTANQKLNVHLFCNYLYNDNNIISDDLTSSALQLAPDAPPLYNDDGSLNWAPVSPGLSGTWTNPLAGLKIRYIGRTSNLVSNALIRYRILPGLDIKASFGYTNLQVNEKRLTPVSASDPGFHQTSGSSSFNSSNIRSWIVEPQASYELHYKKNYLNALVGATFQKKVNEGQIYNANGFTSDALLSNISAATSISSGLTTDIQYKYTAVFGRLTYSYSDKYLANITVRRDGSSRFGPGKQFGNFGAIGVGWNFYKETFIQNNLNFLSFGKLRASYGTTGNDQIGDYSFLDLFGTANYPYQGTIALFPSTLFNPYLAWEINKKFEGGMELGFVKNRILIELSYYRNRSSNQLSDYALSSVTGFNSITSNLQATVQNTGLELVLNSNNIKSKNFTWSTSFNLTIPRNKLVSYPGLATSSNQYYYIIGQPLTIKKVFHLIGVNDTTGVYQFANSKGNATYNPNYGTDKTSVVDLAPKFYGGFQNSFQYKNIQLDLFFQFVRQTGIKTFFITLPGRRRLNQPATVLSRWQNVGDNTDIQKYSQKSGGAASNGYNYSLSSDFNYTDASFIRLKNVAISWQLPQSWRQKLHSQSLKLYMLAQNLFTITRYKGVDPENQTNTSAYALPPLRVITVGMQMRF